MIDAKREIRKEETLRGEKLSPMEQAERHSDAQMLNVNDIMTYALLLDEVDEHALEEFYAGRIRDESLLYPVSALDEILDDYDKVQPGSRMETAFVALAGEILDRFRAQTNDPLLVADCAREALDTYPVYGKMEKKLVAIFGKQMDDALKAGNRYPEARDLCAAAAYSEKRALRQAAQPLASFLQDYPGASAYRPGNLPRRELSFNVTFVLVP